MLPVDRAVRAAVYQYLIDEAVGPSAKDLAGALGLEVLQVEQSLIRLAAGHRLVLDGGHQRVKMVHPFSGVPTPYRAVIADRTWFANCAWDALGVLAMLGDGVAVSSFAGREASWEVQHGRVSPEGLIHVPVKASHFWDDIEFT